MCGQEVLRAGLPATAKNGREQTMYSGCGKWLPAQQKSTENKNKPTLKGVGLEAAGNARTYLLLYPVPQIHSVSVLY